MLPDKIKNMKRSKIIVIGGIGFASLIILSIIVGVIAGDLSGTQIFWILIIPTGLTMVITLIVLIIKEALKKRKADFVENLTKIKEVTMEQAQAIAGQLVRLKQVDEPILGEAKLHDKARIWEVPIKGYWSDDSWTVLIEKSNSENKQLFETKSRENVQKAIESMSSEPFITEQITREHTDPLSGRILKEVENKRRREKKEKEKKEDAGEDL